ncbi:hypothetical protein EU545_04830 [Candidatus Thorarchaeota archaeon]|nr:MAG: hypothetical protein EU545_04830 [Candidatus Thorarchaeota archaeon]
MDKQTILTVLDLLGFDPTENKAKILSAIVKSKTHESDWVPFKKLYNQLLLEKGLTLEERDVKLEPLVYRVLSDLEEEGYISVDRSSYRHGYKSSLSEIAAALRAQILRAKRSIRSRIEEINTDLEIIDELEKRPPVNLLVEAVTGIRPEDRTEYASGIDAVRRMIDEIVYARGRKGDTVRISTSWTGSDWREVHERFNSVGTLARRGASVHILTSKEWSVSDKMEEQMKEYYKKLRDESLDIEIKHRARESAMYQMMTRNRDEIVLVVSEDPVAATFIPRSANPMLIDNSVEVFDREFAEGYDILQEEEREEDR